MSRKGEFHDNAVAENFFHTLKNELVHEADFRRRSEARQAIFKYIELFYNRKRRHSYLNYNTNNNSWWNRNQYKIYFRLNCVCRTGWGLFSG
jgi:transposase InsO family protein